MFRRQVVLLVGILVVSAAASALTLLWHNEPLLGLDLGRRVGATHRQ